MARSRRGDERGGGRGKLRSADDPPELNLQLGRKLGILLLANTVPIIVLIWLGYAIFFNDNVRVVADPAIWQVLLYVVMACVVIGTITWVVMPMARWCRDYPIWHFQRGSKLAWFVPAAAGIAIWAIAWLVCLALAVSAVLVIIHGFVQLGGAAMEAQNNPPAAGPNTD